MRPPAGNGTLTAPSAPPDRDRYPPPASLATCRSGKPCGRDWPASRPTTQSGRFARGNRAAADLLSARSTDRAGDRSTWPHYFVSSPIGTWAARNTAGIAVNAQRVRYLTNQIQLSQKQVPVAVQLPHGRRSLPIDAALDHGRIGDGHSTELLGKTTRRLRDTTIPSVCPERK